MPMLAMTVEDPEKPISDAIAELFLNGIRVLVGLDLLAVVLAGF